MANEWTLENMDDNLDVEEFTVKILREEYGFVLGDWPGAPPADDKTQVVLRDHWIVVQWRHELAGSFVTEVGKEVTLLSMKVGNRTIFKGLIGFASDIPKFLCVTDGASPEGDGQTAYVRRRQSWELYGAWRLAPQHWQTNKST